MPDTPPPLDPQLTALLEAERESRRRIQEQMTDVRARILQRVSETTGTDFGPPDDGGDAPPEGGAPSGGGADSGAGGATPAAPSAAPAATSSAAGAAGPTGIALSGPMLGVIIATSMAAGAIGASLYWTAGDAPTGAVVPPPTDRTSTLEPEPDGDRDVPAETSPAASEEPEEDGAGSTRAEVPPPPRAVTGRPSPPPAAGPAEAGQTSADRERALIDRARTALRAGDPHQALLALMEHERLYPDGRFAQERDRLAIEGLRAAGRHPQADRRTEQFLERYPDSPHAETLRRE